MADGSKRYRFTVETGRDPVTGKRTQRRYTFTRMKDAKREQARLTSAASWPLRTLTGWRPRGG